MVCRENYMKSTRDNYLQSTVPQSRRYHEDPVIREYLILGFHSFGQPSTGKIQRSLNKILHNFPVDEYSGPALWELLMRTRHPECSLKHQPNELSRVLMDER